MKVTKMKLVPSNEKHDAVLSVVSREIAWERVNWWVMASVKLALLALAMRSSNRNLSPR